VIFGRFLRRRDLGHHAHLMAGLRLKPQLFLMMLAVVEKCVKGFIFTLSRGAQIYDGLAIFLVSGDGFAGRKSHSKDRHILLPRKKRKKFRPVIHMLSTLLGYAK
jgi:hypothetical protein